MECNKDEAARAKEMAEKNFFEKDYARAKKFALKAQTLYPPLEGISQFVRNLDVYISSENKVNGQMDWYGILGVSPSADEEAVKMQYRKLALALHPDKNKSIGAEGAFKLVSEAWSLLSDKVKRLAYNQDRSSGRFQHNAPNHSVSRSATPSSNVFCNLNKNASSNMRTGNNNARPPSTFVPPPHKMAGSFWTTFVPPPHKMAGSFWTRCSKCGTHYEYLRTYLNCSLICPNCKVAFVALEKDPPPNVVKASNFSSRQHIQNLQREAGRNHPVKPGRSSTVFQYAQSSGFTGMPFNSTDFQSHSHLRRADSVHAHGSSSVAGASVKQHAGEKREFQGAPSIATYENNFMYKKTRKDDIRMHMVNRMTKGEGAANFGRIYDSGNTNMGTERTHGFSGIISKHHSRRELSLSELRNMLVNKAQSEIRKKLQEWRSIDEAKVTHKDKGNKTQKGTISDKRIGDRHVNSDSVPITSDDTFKNQAYGTINVPDSDFHNFDMDRAENSFADDQVWAAYDDDDGMPRYYARIHMVVSTKPFRIRISWLNSRSNSELGPIDWVGSGFYKTCGDFRVGKYEIAESLNSFSHKVRWTKGNRGVVRIFPGKGEVWALYKNWSPDWDQNTPDEVIHKYDMVEVLEDFSEEEGVLVIPLIKVDGFRTVFQRHSQDQVRKIPKVELFRFSHQVPSYVLTGQESPNAPKGCRELDPAATPLDLLETVTEANETIDKVGKSKEAKLQCSLEKHTSDGSRKNASKPVVADMVNDRPFKNVYKRKKKQG